jgi:hypothetical protein
MSDNLMTGSAQGPAGPPPRSSLLAAFTMPSVGTSLPATIGLPFAWVIQGQQITVAGLGALLVASISGNVASLTNQGATGNASPGTVAAIGAAVGVGGTQGPSGITQTTLLANFTQPAPGTAITVNLGLSSIAGPNGTITIPGGGQYTYLSQVDPTHASVTPTAGTGNAIQGTLVTSGVTVSLSGASGLGSDAQGHAIIPAPGYTWQISPTASGFEAASDWGATAFAGDGAWHTVATIAPGLSLDEILELASLVVIRQIAGTPGGVVFRQWMCAQNNSGTVTGLDGAAVGQAAGNYGAAGLVNAPTGAAMQIVVVGTTLAVQASATQNFFARCALSVDRAGSPNTPAVSAISPVFGLSSATTPVTISGAGLSRCTAAGVIYNGVKYPLTNPIVGSTTITGTLPTAVVGKGVVFTSIGSSDFLSSVNFWFLLAGGPTSDVAINPTVGQTSGGTSVALTATGGLVGLDIPGYGVGLKGVAAIIAAVASDSAATLTSALGSLGTGNVVVSTPAGSRTIPNGWTYATPTPTLATVSPDIGVWEGGSTITGTGTNLQAATFTLGGVACTSVVIGGGGTTYSCVTPASGGATTGGYATLTATTLGGTASLTSTNSFFYLPSGTVAVFIPTVGTTPSAPTDGQQLSAYASQTTAVNNQVQAATAHQPTYVAASSVNGQPAVRRTAAGGAGGVPTYFVGTFASAVTGTTFTHLLVGVRAGVDNKWLMSAYGSGTITSTNSPLLLDNAIFQLGFCNGSLSTAPYATTAVPFVVSSRYDGVHQTTRTNGTDSPSPIAFTGSFNLTNFTFGGDSAGAQNPTTVDCCLEVIASRAWGTADHASLSVYTTHKYGVAA